MKPIDVSPLFGSQSGARDRTDAAIMQAASGLGFMTIAAFAHPVGVAPDAVKTMLGIFSLADAQKRRLLRQKYAPENQNLYRGWFPPTGKGATYKEGIDIGPDLVRPTEVDPSDPLLEATPLPREAELPGWRDAAASYYRGMEKLGGALLRSVARGLRLPEDIFAAVFEGGISTLRLIHYPVRPTDNLAATDDDVFVEHKGRRLAISGKAHVDSSFVTLLAQDGVEGLQARDHAGDRIDIPPQEATLAVNFGKLLDRWTGGRIKATEHRVLGSGRARCSVPFFYEPRANSLIAPLQGLDAAPFTPFEYGDHLWEAMMAFVEFHGMGHLRPPRLRRSA
jgi:isopenicillin N synthase-like dioxygenase